MLPLTPAGIAALAIAGAFLFLLFGAVEVRMQGTRQGTPLLVTLEIRLFGIGLRRRFDLEVVVRSRLRGLLDRTLVRVNGESPAVGIGDAGEERNNTGLLPGDAAGTRAAGSPVARPLREAAAEPGSTRVDRSRIGLWLELLSQLRRAAGPPARYLGRRARFRRVKLHLQIGAGDAMETALLCGGAWTAAGGAVGAVSRWTRLAPQALDLQIRPHFEGPALGVSADCILRVRTAHAMVAAIWLIARFLRAKGLLAWLNDSRLRKGVVGDGRASHPGADEDGDGDPEDDGRRQHGRRRPG